MNIHTCPQCHAPLPADAPQGLCPRCLGAMNFATGTVVPDEDAAGSLPPLSIEELAPHFPPLELIECLGRGGMGVVYKARQKTLNRLVALKLLAPERVRDGQFAQRFEREAQALAALNHPNIVTIHDFGQAGGFYFLLMEFVDGVNLRQAMKAGRLTPEQALAIVPPVCEALQYAHEHGIVHRDIKPENLMLDKTGRVKIADFGIAKMVATNSEGTSSSAAPNSGATILAGTPAYMAPEQRDHQSTDHRADIYSLGVVLYELLTGELPSRNLLPPSKKVSIDVRLDEVVLRALETSPELRWQTAAEMGTRMETIAASPAAIGAEAEEETASTSLKKRLWSLVPMVAVVLAFFNPWGDRAWYWFAAGCAALSVMPSFSSRRKPRRHRQTVAATPGATADVAGTRAEGESSWLVKPLWTLVPLVAVVLAFFNPWGYKAWEWFAAGCAILSMLPAFSSPRHAGHRRQLYDLMGYHTLWAQRLLDLSWPGFLGFLGFLPGWEPWLGFVGFFGFIGVATLVEVFQRRGTRPHPVRLSWWRGTLVKVLVVLALLIPIRLFLLQIYIQAGDSLAPEIPKGSHMLVWIPAMHYAPGDILIYRRPNGNNLSARVVRDEGGKIIVSRNQSPDEPIARADIVGVVIAGTRSSQRSQR